MATLSARGDVFDNAAPDIVDAHGGGGCASFCSNENDAPNNASSCKVRSAAKRGAKRKSPSRGLGGMVLHPPPPPLHPSFQPMYSIVV